MISVVFAILTASLLGSVHCVGMCGAFVALAVGGIDSGDAGARPRTARWRLNGAYQLGRLLTYTTLGVVAGALGAAFNAGGELVGLQRAATALAGATLVVMGAVTLLRIAGIRIGRMPIPGAMTRLAGRGHVLAASLTPVRRAAAIGMLTTLLPCGWLYAFVIAAAGTANPAWGAAAMAAFWLGTVPYLAALGAGVAGLTGPLRKRLPAATALLLVGVGLYTVFGRTAAFAAPFTPPVVTSTGDAAEQATQVRSIDAHEVCPLCTGGDK
jgi:hypothetical protein